jgi:hypothetical protein
LTDAPYERAVQVARACIAAALREGRTLEELEGGLLERRLVEPAPTSPRPRAAAPARRRARRRGGARPARAAR